MSRNVYGILLEIFSNPYQLERTSAVTGSTSHPARLFNEDDFRAWIRERCRNGAQALASLEDTAVVALHRKASEEPRRCVCGHPWQLHDQNPPLPLCRGGAEGRSVGPCRCAGFKVAK